MMSQDMHQMVELANKVQLERWNAEKEDYVV